MALVTFDLFSALIDSRTGGSAALAGIAAAHGWDVSGTALFDDWDARNKASQQDLAEWVPFAEHSRRALATTYAARGLAADPAADADLLLGSLPSWPLWPDVATALPEIGRAHLLGVLSNVDDALFRATRAAALVDDDAVFTSERLHAYKPHPELYLRARDAGVDVHVPASARDTRGALGAGLTVVRVARPGHRVDPAGPQPEHEVADLTGLTAVLDRLVPGT